MRGVPQGTVDGLAQSRRARWKAWALFCRSASGTKTCPRADTAKPVFDGTLKQALAVDLGQSPFLNVLSDRKINETLRLMGRGPNERVTRELAQEICLRTGSKALLAGSISRLGNQYMVGLEAVGCGNGDSLAKEQAAATSKEDAVKTLGNVAAVLRAHLGESLASVQKFDVPIEATTSSLEAWKALSMGVTTQREKSDAEAILFYRRAMELDPNFAMAYARHRSVVPESWAGQSRCGEPAKGICTARPRQ